MGPETLLKMNNNIKREALYDSCGYQSFTRGPQFVVLLMESLFYFYFALCIINFKTKLYSAFFYLSLFTVFSKSKFLDGQEL